MQLTIEQAVEAHKAGKLEEAEAIYRAILKEQPKHPDANHNLGVLAISVNKIAAALPLLRTALEANPNQGQYWLSYIDALIKDNQPETARVVLEQGKKMGLSGEQVDALSQRLASRSEEPESDKAQSLTFTQQRKKFSAKKEKKKNVSSSQRSPGHAGGPSQGEVNDLLTQYQSGQYEVAEKLAISMTQRHPNHQFAWKVLGAVLGTSGRLHDAVVANQKAVALAPNDVEAHSNLGTTLKDLGRLEEAEANYRQAITLKPDYAQAHSNLGTTLKDLGRLEEAEASYRQAITLKPDYAEAHSNLGVAIQDLGRLEEAEASYRQAITLKPDLAEAHSNLVFLLASAGKVNSSVKAAHQHSANASLIASHKFERWKCVKQPRRLRVAFVSGDFSNHPVGYFLESVLDKLDQSKVELVAYTTQNKTDSLTDRIKPYFSFWKTLVGISDQKAASTIQNDGVHVLIDLSGHTRGNRLSVFAYRPAPVQVTWLGYFGTTGITEIDYILGDPNVTPIKESNHFTEKIWQLPESYLCFTPPEFDLEVNLLPAKSTGVITFGCFNKPSKVTDDVIAVWAKILHAVPHSQLFLKGKTLSAPTQRVHIEARFACHGITSNRLILEGESSRSDLLACYCRVDVALDPFPYPGGTTSVESLWMGVPVLTLRGSHFLSHVGETIAINAGLPDWIAFDTEDYVVRAVALASDYEKLAKLRMGLRQQVLASPLFDSTRFARNLEAAIWAMWQKSNESNITP